MLRSRPRLTACRACLFALLILPVLPIAVVAQTVPGFRTPSRDAIKAEFLANVMKGLDVTRKDWTDNVRADRLDKLMALYTSDAVIIPPDGFPLKGQDDIRGFWAGILPRIGDMDAGLVDMDASGQMAMVAGGYSLELLQGGEAPLKKSGGLLTVYTQVGHKWYIRAQVFGGQIPELPKQ